jgi:ABC-type uncharacterized transport system permease subunit
MTSVVALSAIVAFAASTVLYVGELSAREGRKHQTGFAALLAALLLTLVLAGELVAARGPAALLAPGDNLVSLTLLLGIVYLVAQGSSATRVAGVLVAPAGTILLSAFLLQVPIVESASPELRGMLLLHIGLSVLGLGMLGVAAIMAAVYLVQERLLRQRRFGVLFQRLPGLQELDDAYYRLVVGGFIIYTMAVALGVAWSLSAPHSGLDLRVLLGSISWLFFAGVILSRVKSGWRGRQAAWLTIAGCVACYAILGLYSGGGR